MTLEEQYKQWDELCLAGKGQMIPSDKNTMTVKYFTEEGVFVKVMCHNKGIPISTTITKDEMGITKFFDGKNRKYTKVE